MSRAPRSSGASADVLVRSIGVAEAPADPEPRSTSPKLAFELVESAGDWSTFASVEDIVAAAVGAVARAPQLARVLPKGALEAVVVLSDDCEIAAYNGQYRGQSKPTNVLSFPAPRNLPVPEGAARALGDIVLAVETIGREAEEQGVPAAHHLQHLVVHGLLHLVGYDHIEIADAEEMEALETAILATLGVPDPYAGSEPLVSPQEA